MPAAAQTESTPQHVRAGRPPRRSSTPGEVERVLITGRLEEMLPQQLSQFGTRVDVVTAAQIQDGGYLDIAQSLQNLVPGLYIANQNGPFDYVDISLQGSRIADVLWLIDGVAHQQSSLCRDDSARHAALGHGRENRSARGRAVALLRHPGHRRRDQHRDQGVHRRPQRSCERRLRYQRRPPCRRLFQRYARRPSLCGFRICRQVGRLPAIPRRGLPAERDGSQSRLRGSDDRRQVCVRLQQCAADSARAICIRT